MLRGPIPDNMFLCHVCDNPPCVNPDHLFLGTQQDNIRDRDSKGRGSSVLVVQEVVEIREKYDTGKYTCLQLAREYGISRRGIGKIVSGETWKYVPVGTNTCVDYAKVSTSRITRIQADEIITEYRKGYSYDALAIMYKMSKSQIARVIRGEVRNYSL